jgi:hypothetical protein
MNYVVRLYKGKSKMGEIGPFDSMATAKAQATALKGQLGAGVTARPGRAQAKAKKNPPKKNPSKNPPKKNPILTRYKGQPIRRAGVLFEVAPYGERFKTLNDAKNYIDTFGSPKANPAKTRYKGHDIVAMGNSYEVQPYGRSFASLARAKTWIDGHVRGAKKNPASCKRKNPRRNPSGYTLSELRHMIRRAAEDGQVRKLKAYVADFVALGGAPSEAARLASV